MTLAFMPPMAAPEMETVVAQAVAKPAAPVLPKYVKGWRFWWSAFRLDARPVVWSLRNHPEEWKVSREPDRFSGGRLMHIPSQHEFKVGSFRAPSRAGLYHARCGCAEQAARFHTGQAMNFNANAMAFMRMKRREQRLAALGERVGIPQQFHDHFVTK